MTIHDQQPTCPERIANEFGALQCRQKAGHKDGPNPTGHYFISSSVPQVNDTEARDE